MQKPSQLPKYHRITDNLSKLFNKILTKTPYNLRTYQFAKHSQLQSTKILADDFEFDTTNPDDEFSFENYSDVIVSIVNGSNQKLCAGIYGEWGTGKTTLMKLVERKLRPHVFYWKNVPGEDSEKLRTFLRQSFDILLRLRHLQDATESGGERSS